MIKEICSWLQTFRPFNQEAVGHKWSMGRCPISKIIFVDLHVIFTERELRSLYAIAVPSVCLSSVTLVHPTQPVEMFGTFLPLECYISETVQDRR